MAEIDGRSFSLLAVLALGSGAVVLAVSLTSLAATLLGVALQIF